MARLGPLAEELKTVASNNLCSTHSKLKAYEITDTVKLRPAPFNDRKPQCSKDVSDYFLVPQEHSRGHIALSAHDLDLLLTKIGAFPALSSVINAFERDGSDYHRGIASVHYSPVYGDQPSTTTQLCMLLKYAERNRPQKCHPMAEDYDAYDEVNSWSVRQMAFYQSYDARRNFETIVFVNASNEIATTMGQAYRDEKRDTKPYDCCLEVPQMVVRSLCANWAGYIAALHRAVEEVMLDARFTEPSELRVGEANVKSLQRCADLTDRLLHISHVMGNNLFILEAMIVEARKRHAVLQQTTESETDAFEESTRQVMMELKLHHNHVLLIIGRLERTTAKIRDLLSLRNSYIMEQMTGRSILEARAVRVIAIVTLCFLPPTFTAGLLNIEAFSFPALAGNKLVVEVGPSFYFYLALTLPLLAVTLGGWLLWDRMSLRRTRHGELVLSGHQV